MAGPFKYLPDHSGTAELMNSHGVRQHVHDVVAPDALEHARSISPIFEGKYRDSLGISPGEENLPESGRPSRRPVAYLYTDAEHGLAVEKDHHVLSRTRDYIEQKYGGKP